MVSDVKPTLYLHVGTWKTGTTALQKFLATNADLLKEENIFYPNIGLFGIKEAIAHHKFAWTFGFGNKLQMESGNPEPWIQLGEKNWPDNAIVIISSESLYQAVLSSECAHKIRHWLSNFDVKVVIYLRPQEELLESGYRNQVKLGKVKEDIYSYAHNKNYYYDRQLGHITKVFGEKNVLVRPYCKTTLINADICSDFLQLIGKQNISNLHTIDEPANKSLSDELLCFLLQANQLDTSQQFKTNFNNYMKRLVESSQEGGVSDNSSYQLVTQEWRNKIRAQYRECNEVLVKDYAPEFKAFLSEPTPYYEKNYDQNTDESRLKEDAFNLYKLLVESYGNKVSYFDRFRSYKSLVESAVLFYKNNIN